MTPLERAAVVVDDTKLLGIVERAIKRAVDEETAALRDKLKRIKSVYWLVYVLDTYRGNKRWLQYRFHSDAGPYPLRRAAREFADVKRSQGFEVQVVRVLVLRKKRKKHAQGR